MEYKDEDRLNDIIERTLKMVRERQPVFGDSINTTENAMRFCELRMAGKEREEFLVLYLNAQHELIEDKVEFVGTINSAAVYPREIAKSALLKNAAAVILCHNHPSGNLDPSEADISLTKDLTDALRLIDVRVIDHIIVGNGSMSFRQRGVL